MTALYGIILQISIKFRDGEMGSGWLLGDSGYVEKEL